MFDWNVLKIILPCLILAALAGFFLGWFLKKLFCEKEHESYEGKLREKGDEISRLRASVSNVKGAAVAENSKDDAEISVWKKKVSSLESDLRICHDRQATMEGELKDYSAKAVGFVSGADADADADLLRTKLQASESEKLHLISKSGSSSDLDAEVAELRVKLQEAESEKIYLLGRVKKAEAGETIKIVPMDQRDDLELVHGIGPVIERMLYDLGIYFFKDIAEWDAAKIAEINEQLPGFQGRIEREGWIESAKEEYFKKYGEKL